MSISALGVRPDSGQANESLSKLSQDYDKFMKLLVAQVQHQDPLKPMDGTEFISQLAQLTQVEQSVRVNDQLGALRSELSVAGAMYETALIGREVTVPSEKVSLGEGEASFAYKLSGDAAGVKALVTDGSGQVVREIDGLSGKAGELHDVVWDGLTDSGSRAAPGEYKISLSVESGDAEFSSYVSSMVRSVDYTSGDKMLKLENGSLVSSGSVVRAS